MSENLQTSVPRLDRVPAQSNEDALMKFFSRYEPVLDVRPVDPSVRPCAGSCGRTVALNVSVCVRCRNAPRHPASGQ